MTPDRDVSAQAASGTYAAPWTLAVLLAAAAVWSLTVGNCPISLGDQWRYLLHALDLAAQPATARTFPNFEIM